MVIENGAVGTTRATVTIRLSIAKPGDYLIAFPTEDEGETLRRHNPRGELIRSSGRLVWIEPERIYGEG